MRVLIVDDELAALQRLETMLQELDVEVVGAAAGGLEAIALARERAPEVVLLDIAMPEVDGFDVARHLPPPRPLIVFQTAHSEHALRAFEHEAVDYVLKPVRLERLRQALERAGRRLAGGAEPHLTPRLLDRLSRAMGEAGAAGARRRVLAQDGRGFRLLALPEIVRFTADAGEVWAETAERRFLLNYSLSQLEADTAGAFVRISRSDLVGIDRIERLQPDEDGSGKVTLRDGRSLRVSRRRMLEVRTSLER